MADYVGGIFAEISQSGMTVDILQCETTETAEYSQTHYVDFGVEITFSIEAEEVFV
jgi:hypothetical protein